MYAKEFKESAIELLEFLLKISKEELEGKVLDDKKIQYYEGYHEGLEYAIQMIGTLPT